MESVESLGWMGSWGRYELYIIMSVKSLSVDDIFLLKFFCPFFYDTVNIFILSHIRFSFLLSSLIKE